MALLNMNMNDLPDAQNFDPVPAGNYACEVVASEVKKTKAGTGTYLDCQVKLIDGHPLNEKNGKKYGGRVVFAKYTLTHPNAQAVQIGLGQLKQLGQALGLSTVNDSEQLHDKPFIARIVVKKDAEYGDKNEIKKAMPIDGASQNTSAGSSSSGPVWAR